MGCIKQQPHLGSTSPLKEGKLESNEMPPERRLTLVRKLTESGSHPCSVSPQHLLFSIGEQLERAPSVTSERDSKHGSNTPRKSGSLKKSPRKFFYDVTTPLLIYFFDENLASSRHPCSGRGADLQVRALPSLITTPLSRTAGPLGLGVPLLYEHPAISATDSQREERRGH